MAVALVGSVTTLTRITSGTTITAANSGGGADTAFDVVTVGTGTTLQFSSTHAAHGTNGLKVATGSTTTVTYAEWSSLGSQTGTVYFRVYVYFTANPGTGYRLFNIQNSSGSTTGFLFVNSTGTVYLADSGSTARATTTNTVNLNGWTRLEGFIVPSTTVGQLSISMYKTMDSVTATETETSAASFNTGANLAHILFGITGNIANAGPYWLDDAGVSTAGYLGHA